MIGLRYWRMKRRMKLLELAEQAGCSAHTIRILERTAKPTTSSIIVAALAKALNVPMAELFREYPDDALEQGDHPGRAGKAPPAHPLERYRREHNLSLEELAARLEVGSRQRAWQLCAQAEAPGWCMQKLREHELAHNKTDI